MKPQRASDDCFPVLSRISSSRTRVGVRDRGGAAHEHRREGRKRSKRARKMGRWQDQAMPTEAPIRIEPSDRRLAPPRSVVVLIEGTQEQPTAVCRKDSMRLSRALGELLVPYSPDLREVSRESSIAIKGSLQ